MWKCSHSTINQCVPGFSETHWIYVCMHGCRHVWHWIWSWLKVTIWFHSFHSAEKIEMKSAGCFEEPNSPMDFLLGLNHYKNHDRFFISWVDSSNLERHRCRYLPSPWRYQDQIAWKLHRRSFIVRLDSKSPIESHSTIDRAILNHIKCSCRDYSIFLSNERRVNSWESPGLAGSPFECSTKMKYLDSYASAPQAI
jgi:hypothetical protein